MLKNNLKKRKRLLLNSRIYYLSKYFLKKESLEKKRKDIEILITKFIQILNRISTKKVSLENIKSKFEISYYKKLNNIEKHENDERFKTKKGVRLTPSILIKYRTDTILDDNENLILLHKVSRRLNHYASYDTIINLFNFLKNGGIINYDYINKKLWTFCPCKKEERDKNNRIIGYTDIICQGRIYLIDLINRLTNDKKELLEFHNKIYWNVRRNSFLNTFNLKDCIFCVNPLKLNSIGYKLDINKIPLNKHKYFQKINIDNIYRCNTCTRLWCDTCKGEFVLKFDINTHDELSCNQYLNKNKEDIIPIGVIKCSFCKILITKYEGCNHLVCLLCKHETCYHCSSNITGIGYQHFKNSHTDIKCPLDAGFDHIIN